MRIEIILFILVTHWLADFVFQNNWMASNKSSRWDALLYHTGTYALVWFLSAILWYMFKRSMSTHDLIVNYWLWLFLPITFISHTIIDYYTSRVNKQLLNESYSVKDLPNHHKFFAAIGFDQLMHYFQLFLTYYLLNKL